MTQLELARAGIVSKQVEQVARAEGLSPETVRQMVAEGTVVIPFNKKGRCEVVGIGKGLTTKVSASIGTAKDSVQYDEEFSKLAVAEKAGADALMDLSIGGDLDYLRREVLMRTRKPVGTMPIYQTFMEARQKGGILSTDPQDIFKTIEKQAKDGVDFMGLHCAMTLKTLELAQRQGRLNDLVSWGGSLLAGWMLEHREENPLYTQFDRLLEIAKEYDVTLSLADGLRPGCTADSLDRAQVQELVLLGELVDRARAFGVQIMIKGPGHAPLPHLATTVQLMKQMCKGAPYFVFGPVSTDIAPGYDHITAAIGGAFSAAAGADMLCYVTPAEHVRFPSVQDVRDGVMAARIAAHAGDLAKNIEKARLWDDAVSRARNPWDKELQRKHVLDQEALGGIAVSDSMEGEQPCDTCGDQCAMKAVNKYFGQSRSFC